MFTAFLSLLCHIFELWPDAANTLTRKLVFAGIIRLTLDISVKYGYVHTVYLILSLVVVVIIKALFHDGDHVTLIA